MKNPRLCEKCTAAGAKAVDCVCSPAPRLCGACTLSHGCPSLANVDPKAWRKANAPEEDMTRPTVDRLKALPFVADCWQAKRKLGANSNKVALHVPDVIGYFTNGIFFAIELKRAHRLGCPCDSCAGQRAWGERLIAAGGVFVGDCRSADQAVAGLTAAWEAKARAA